MPTTGFSADTSGWIAVLPLAAMEQHGPHLPVGVDAMIAEGMVARCAAALPPDSPVTFLPLQQVCKSDEHIGFPGTLTLDWDIAIRTWTQIGDSVARAGVRKLVLVTSHGGNTAAMEIAARELRIRHGMLVVTTSWGRLGKWQEIYDYGPIMTDIHGGNCETSLMLALRPDLVDLARAEDFPSAQSDLKARHRRLGYHGSDANIAWVAQDLNPAGAVGDASAASAQNGERDIASMVTGFRELMDEIAATLPPGTPS
jgi:creatinine amidohydrolase